MKILFVLALMVCCVLHGEYIALLKPHTYLASDCSGLIVTFGDVSPYVCRVQIIFSSERLLSGHLWQRAPHSADHMVSLYFA